MVTWDEEKTPGISIVGGKQVRTYRIQGFCLSTDEKPVEGVTNGSVLGEMDTGKAFVFDEEGQQWYEWGAAT